MKMPKPAASMRYSGQCLFSAFNIRHPVSVFGSIHRGRNVPRNVMPIRPHDCEAASKRYQRHAEQQPMIALKSVRAFRDGVIGSCKWVRFEELNGNNLQSWSADSEMPRPANPSSVGSANRRG